MLHPKYMIVNKTSMPIICEKQTIMPYTNDYFNHAKDRATCKVPGYSSSQSTDITTIGLSGAIQLELENKLDVITEKLP